MTFWFKILRDTKVRVEKDRGKKFRSRLASSFSGIVHSIRSLGRRPNVGVKVYFVDENVQFMNHSMNLNCDSKNIIFSLPEVYDMIYFALTKFLGSIATSKYVKSKR